jgi:hypothetical protein
MEGDCGAEITAPLRHGPALATADPADLGTGASAMTEATHSREPTLPLSGARRVNEVCNRFELAWRR